MDINQKIVCTQVHEIFKYIDEDKINLIPHEILNVIENNADESIEFLIDWDMPLENQDIAEDTINILGWFNYKYWTNDVNEKNKLKQLYYPQPIDFKNSSKNKSITENKLVAENMQIAEINENNIAEGFSNGILEKILEFIKKFLGHIGLI